MDLGPPALANPADGRAQALPFAASAPLLIPAALCPAFLASSLAAESTGAAVQKRSFPEREEEDWILVRTTDGFAGWVHGSLIR